MRDRRFWNNYEAHNDSPVSGTPAAAVSPRIAGPPLQGSTLRARSAAASPPGQARLLPVPFPASARQTARAVHHKARCLRALASLLAAGDGARPARTASGGRRRRCAAMRAAATETGSATPCAACVFVVRRAKTAYLCWLT